MYRKMPWRVVACPAAGLEKQKLLSLVREQNLPPARKGSWDRQYLLVAGLWVVRWLRALLVACRATTITHDCDLMIFCSISILLLVHGCLSRHVQPIASGVLLVMAVSCSCHHGLVVNLTAFFTGETLQQFVPASIS